MVHTCVEVRIQNMQMFYVISLTNGRPDLTTENYWIKKFHWTHFFWLNKDIFFIRQKTPVGYKNFLNISIFWLNENIFSLNDEILTKQKLIECKYKNIEYKNVFLQHFSNHKPGSSGMDVYNYWYFWKDKKWWIYCFWNTWTFDL